MQLTIEIEDSMIDNVMYILDRLKPDIKIVDRELLDIESIDKNDEDYEYIIKGREERASSPQNYGSLDDIEHKSERLDFSSFKVDNFKDVDGLDYQKSIRDE